MDDAVGDYHGSGMRSSQHAPWNRLVEKHGGKAGGGGFHIPAKNVQAFHAEAAKAGYFHGSRGHYLMRHKKHGPDEQLSEQFAEDTHESFHAYKNSGVLTGLIKQHGGLPPTNQGGSTKFKIPKKNARAFHASALSAGLKHGEHYQTLPPATQHQEDYLPPDATPVTMAGPVLAPLVQFREEAVEQFSEPVHLGEGIYAHKHGYDANGNHSVWVSQGANRARKIQTLYLPKSHSHFGKQKHGKIKGDVPADVADELKRYHKQYHRGEGIKK